MAAAGQTPGEHEGFREVINDLWILIRTYAKQETLDPLLMLKKFLTLGLLGAILLAVGLGLGTLAVIRALQTETGPHLTGSWDWVPYLAGMVFTGIATGISVWTIKRPFRHEEAAS